jgi:hypothetical protein
VDIRLSDAYFNSINITYGSATVQGDSGGAIAAVIEQIYDSSNRKLVVDEITPGMTQASAKDTTVFPLLFSNYAGYYSGINVLNVGAPTTIKAQFFSSITGQKTTETTATLATNEVVNLYIPAICPKGWYGSAIITGASGSDQIMAVISNVASSAAGTEGSGVNGLVPANATKKIVAPLAYVNKYPGSNWVTGLQISNLGGATTTLHAKLVKAPLSPGAATFNLPDMQATPNQSVTWFLPNYLSTLGQGWFGAAYIWSDDQNIMGVINQDNMTVGMTGAYLGINY